MSFLLQDVFGPRSTRAGRCTRHRDGVQGIGLRFFFRMFARTGRWVTVIIFVCAGCAPPRAVPAIECVTTYGGQSRSLTVEPTSDPYRVTPINIADRFDFKAVLVMEANHTALLNLYTYGRGERGSFLIHEMKTVLRLPSATRASAGRFGFTGEQIIYDHNERELRYWCGFRRGR